MLQRTLHEALRGGGDFAEVFAEDRRVASARLDDAKVEELVSGRERGAGIRVVRGDTTGFAHTADLSEDGLRTAAEAAAAAARGTPGAANVVALERRAVPSTHEVPPGVYIIATQRLQAVHSERLTRPVFSASTRSCEWMSARPMATASKPSRIACSTLASDFTPPR